MKFFAFVLLLLMCSTAWGQSSLQEMLQAERAFARMGDRLGIKAAFLQYLADSGMVFLPQPQLGKPVYQNLQEGAAKLWWAPAYGIVSSGGDMGFTTGPYIYKLNPQDKASWRYGHFTSVWVKQPDGNWKNVADFGTPHAAPTGPLPYPSSDRLHSLPDGAPGGTKALLLQQDLAHPAPVTQRGTAIYRQGQLPNYTTGQAYVQQEGQHYCEWQALHSAVASKGDFGYSWGQYTTAENQKGYYLRIWQWQPGGWKLLLESLNRENP